MLKATISIFCILLFNIQYVFSKENCDHLGKLLYEEFNCKPVKYDTNKCPIDYQCEFGLNEDYCVYNSKKYTINERIKLEWIWGSCNTDCVCLNNGK